ncbi:metalloprotease [Coemansia sp. RSA 1824]|nr:metalloprotease [Coemansia sp. RSA 1824]KAJ2257103.1 metalloprotease [Coemansia sp. RSA 454]
MSPVFETLPSLPTRSGTQCLPPVASFETNFESRTSVDSHTAYTEFVGELDKSPSDTRAYRLIRLSNGLVAMVVHDKEESKACAALDVNVGSLADPQELQGLAHFCEHLLFMYLSAHGGYSNAYTDLEDTCYYFEVRYDALGGALDRFSQFFIEPLFTADCTDREVKAVDSEHKKNIQNDMWRQYQLEKELSSPDHPFSMFATGNYDTLSGAARRMGVDLRERLLDFHAKYYSADIMRLVVVGRDSLDQLTEWVVSKFSGIQSKGLTKPLFKGHPLTAREMGQMIYLKSIREQRTLDLTFALPDLKPYHRSKPAQYLGSLLGHEGRGSILSCLRKRGWATTIVAGRAPTSAEGFDMFKITVSLTEPGLENYTEVVRMVFAYIQLLQSKRPQRWFHDELRRISEIEYRFMEKYDAVALASSLASVMQNRYLSAECMLSDSVRLKDFDEDLLVWTQGFLKPDNVRIVLAARDLDVEFDRTEKHYGLDYRTEPISEQLMHEIRGDLEYDELHLPEPNQFIPDNMEVKSERHDTVCEAPTLLKLAEGLELWFKQDDRFFLPRGNVRLLIETPRAYESPLTSVFNQLFMMVLKDTLTEITYDAEIAGLWFEIRDTIEGIVVHIDGFNDKLLQLLEILVKTLRTCKVEQTQFDVYSREVKKKLDNARHSEPYGHVQTNTSFLNQGIMWRFMDKLAAFDLVTIDRLQLFIDSLFEQTRVQMLVTGNFEEREAVAAASMVQSLLGSRALPEYARRVPRALLHEPGVYVHHALMPEKGNVNSCVDYSVYTGMTSDHRGRVVLDLLSLIMQEPFFDQLRTKEQLGYITYSTERKYNGGHMTLRLLVQSEASPIYVRMRIDHFLREFRSRLDEMTLEKFDGYVSSLRVAREEKIKNLFEESGRMWRHVSSGYYEFDRIATDLEILRTVSQRELLEFWDMYVDKQRASAYISLAATIWSTKIAQPTDEELEKFGDGVHAVHGSLEHDGERVLSVEHVDRVLRQMDEAGDDEERALERIISEYESMVKGEADVEKAVAKMRKPASHVRTAIAMAREQNKPVCGKADNGLLNMGVVRSPSGDWLFREASAFRATLRQSGAPVPTRPLVPKY